MSSSANKRRMAPRAIVFSLLVSLSALLLFPGMAGAHDPDCGRVIGSTFAVGYPPNDYAFLADNGVDYSFSHSHFASNDFAIFQTHDPWTATVVKDAITDAGHSWDVFTPADLDGFPFSGYRVVVLNWDHTQVTAFETEHTAALAKLQTYVRNGGILWVQAAILAGGDNNFTMPFGGTETFGVSFSDAIVDPSSDLVTGADNPLTGNEASLASYGGLAAGSHIIARQGDASGPTSLYTFRACPTGSYKPDGRIRKGSGSYVGNNVYNTTGSSQSRTGSAHRGDTITFSISAQNDGDFSDRLTIDADHGSSTKYGVKYFRGTTDITSAVVAGTYRTGTLAPGAATVITVKVKVKSTATVGSSITRLVTISSGAEPPKRDTVKFIGKRG
jgi:hypothetical protein